MKNGLVAALSLIFGAAFGTWVTAKVLKDKYEIKTQNEIAAVRARLLEERREQRARKSDTQKDPQKAEAASQAARSYAPSGQEDAVAQIVGSDNTPEIISGGVYDQPANPNQRVSVLYFTDGTLVRLPEINRVLREDEIDEWFGGRWVLDKFGTPESEDTRVCVRNNELSTDYEIVQVACSRREYIQSHKPRS